MEKAYSPMINNDAASEHLVGSTFTFSTTPSTLVGIDDHGPGVWDRCHIEMVIPEKPRGRTDCEPLRESMSAPPPLPAIALDHGRARLLSDQQIYLVHNHGLVEPLVTKAHLKNWGDRDVCGEFSMPHGRREPLPDRAKPSGNGDGRGGLVIHSAAMRDVLALVAKIAATDTPVLIRGESGVGKQAIAREIHRRSLRADNPFVRVACQAISETDLTSLLFGADASGAVENSKGPHGLWEEARGGTLFLDGVGALPLWALFRLFDLVQLSNAGPAERRFRVIASTPFDLEAAAADRSCPGLYRYLSGIQVNVLPLRHRRDDVLPLATHFLSLSESVARANTAPRGFTLEARQCLLDHEWPGNVPELAGVVAGVAMLTDEAMIGPESIVKSLGKSVRKSDEGAITVPFVGNLKAMERWIIEEAVRRHCGNKAAAAKALGLHRRTLYRILNRNPDGPESKLYPKVRLAAEGGVAGNDCSGAIGRR